MNRTNQMRTAQQLAKMYGVNALNQNNASKLVRTYFFKTINQNAINKAKKNINNKGGLIEVLHMVALYDALYTELQHALKNPHIPEQFKMKVRQNLKNLTNKSTTIQGKINTIRKIYASIFTRSPN
jgi:hypothetical protein